MEFIPELQKSLHRQQSDLFKYYSKILMIRTDFHWSDNTDRSHYEDEHQFSRDMSILMLRLSEYPGVIGYAWVLEESLSGRLHAHAAIYVNGQQHCKKWGFQGVMENLWREITDREGRIFNCQDKKEYRHDIRRPISFDDTKGRKAMRYVVNYLAKAEQKPFDPIYHISRLPDMNNKPVGRPRSRHR
ncbi:rolling circle replication-associated protein [Cronobacter sakazakii]|uniref:rolling circle replication-associated protein n=2 Tax=Cronobacter sakazakii TaxID=28141 RepID=UPI0011E47F1D|nr:inovirus-type Gp2 protein [Cronobacter sakazakii]MDT3610295.1 inovirus-type Gp2 protein [Cronobacter sakazakii]QWR80011.1 inovirus Gp2 family protein [Cronobacter sakazakii]TYD49632.1 inovirus Gp2 family protein [Cronobacter sakazakii]